MIRIDRDQLAIATEALMVASGSAVDAKGLRVFANFPQLSATKAPMRPGTASSEFNTFRDTTDWQRCQAIALAAVVSLTGRPVAGFTDEVEIALPDIAERVA